MNLFPLAQLDGGHILFALIGRRQRFFGIAFLVLLVGLGFQWWGWWLWAALILVIGRGTVRHPEVFDPEISPVGVRRSLGWLCVAIFLITFAPFPIRL
jgi:membrane-associated protease RseP (regulator of RpoE activity)